MVNIGYNGVVNTNTVNKQANTHRRTVELWILQCKRLKINEHMFPVLNMLFLVISFVINERHRTSCLYAPVFTTSCKIRSFQVSIMLNLEHKCWHRLVILASELSSCNLLIHGKQIGQTNCILKVYDSLSNCSNQLE